ncbi:P-loop containing nucleoside triphosphate hydrolase protein, partial [Chytriomyces sp. MP71]
MAPASSNQPSDSKENPHTLLTNSSSVRVAVRIRPNPTSQQDHASHLKPFSASTLSVICPDSNSSLFSPSENPNAISSAVVAAAADVLWEYDSVWPQDSTQDHIFESEVEPLVNAFVQGFNATLFAYGQTGSGKSLTNAIASITPSDSAISLSDLSATSGMVSRAIHAIFAKLEETRACDCTQSLSIKVSFLELHNEEWVDLLKEKKKPNSAKSSSAKPTTSTNYCHDEVTIREDKDGRLFIHGATSILVSDAESALKLLAKGSRLRTTAATSMNETSSRSHAIFSLSLTILQMTAPMSPLSISDRSTIPNENRGLVITSKFHFVDLAGSERLKRTQSVGDRKTEGISINQGLLVLGRVINCLSEMKPNATEAVVPYRDSKLTRFLQDSLGGNSKTVMLACVSSLEADLPESINTLRYASRARGIQ